MIRRRALFGLAGIAGIAGLLMGFLIASRGSPLEEALSRALVLGRPLLELRSPEAGSSHAPGSVPVVVNIRSSERVAEGSFRCVLNGRDVTHQLTLGSNGAAGRVYPLRAGQNSLRIEIYAQGLWTPRFYQDAIDVSFRVRPALRLDQT